MERVRFMFTMVNFSYVLMTLLMFAGLFLIGLILLQRGRGGGLAGALGGMGGQSWAGTRAGDVFTRITIGVASAWILLCAGSVVALHNSQLSRTTGFANAAAVKAEDAAKEAERAKAELKRANAAEEDENLLLDPQSLITTPESKPPAGAENEKKPEVEKDDKHKTLPNPTDAKPETSVPGGDQTPEAPKSQEPVPEKPAEDQPK